MQIWKLEADGENFRPLINDPEYSFASVLVERRLPSNWEPPLFIELNHSAPVPDFWAWISSFAVFSARAIEEVGVLCGDEIRSFVAHTDQGQTLHIVDVCRELDILDFAASDIGRESYHFREFDAGSLPPLFRVRGVDSHVFCSRVFAQKMTDIACTGVIFADPCVAVLDAILEGGFRSEFP